MPLKDPTARAKYLKERYQLKRDERLRKQKEYYAEHPEEHAVRNKSYRSRNKAKYNAYMRVWTQKKRQYLYDIKDVPCLDCGNKFHPACMEFDHREDEIKLFNIGRLSDWNKNNIEAEIAKCDIVCANCHNLRTFNRIKRMA
jgi:hypothetical protein